MGFSQLSVWNDPRTSSVLRWYQAVANNEKPAKFQICKRIPIEIDLDKSHIEDLWKVHAMATDEFVKLWTKIKDNKVELSEYNIPDQSLMDLNVELVNRMLNSCNFCRWNCKVDRTKIDLDPDEKSGTCQLGEITRVGSFFHHRGEELIYRGTEGSGTIFFTSCNMRCGFCQNGNISQDKENGMQTSQDDLAAMAWLLRMEGCHNINYVGGDPTIHLHTIIRSIAKLGDSIPSSEQLNRIRKVKSDFFLRYPLENDKATHKGQFNAPLLWNDNFFMSNETMRILRTVIDVWLPDFKFGSNKKCATRLSRTPWYWETITTNHQVIYDWKEDFTIRHLVMPNHVECCSYPIMDWISENIPLAPVNIMGQYHPDSFTNPQTTEYNPKYEDISRRPTKKEIVDVIKYAANLGLNFETVTYH